MQPMLSYSRGPTEAPLLTTTIGEQLRMTADRFPDREALAYGEHDRACVPVPFYPRSRSSAA